jgi:N-acetylglucosaminyl-diphospho-decaprenol L-rhamnosyltransferase
MIKFNRDCTVVITTFYAGDKLLKCIKNIPKNFKIIIIDNGREVKNINIFKKYKNIKYIIPKSNLGVPKSYNLAFRHVKTPFMFNTQPDVIVNKNCLQKLLIKANKYKNAAILSPIIFHSGKYLKEGDYKSLAYLKKSNNISTQHVNNKKPPTKDITVDAVTGTAMLIRRKFLKSIGLWDDNIFNYFEDMDICLRLQKKGYNVMKIFNTRVDHFAFSSHKPQIHLKMDFSRNWHYSWSILYFNRKHGSRFFSTLQSLSLIFKYIIKVLFYGMLFNKKSNDYFAKLYGTICSIVNLKSFYRPSIH